MTVDCTYPVCGCIKTESNGRKASCNKAFRKQESDAIKLAEKIKNKKPIKKVSDKMKIELTEYTHLRRQFLKENPTCALYPHLRSETVHHMKGRVGELLCDVRFWKPLSLVAHTFIEENPDWAKENGFSLKRNGI